MNLDFYHEQQRDAMEAAKASGDPEIVNAAFRFIVGFVPGNSTVH